MDKKIFRQNEANFGTSPEQLQDYIRVTNPFVWMILVAVIVLLSGGIFAAVFGKIEVTLNTFAIVQGGQATVYVATPDAYKIKEGMAVRFPNNDVVTNIDHITWNEDGTLVRAYFAINLPDATADKPYPCVIVTDVVSPISFLID